MKYFIITSTIKDGEFEYLQQSPRRAKSEEEAIEIIRKENQDWIENDYREQDDIYAKEVTEEEFKILKKYIY